MKKIITSFLLFAFIFIKGQNLPISGLPAASALTGTEVTVLVQGGATKKVALSAIAGSSTFSFVPYNGANGQVNLGSNTLLAGPIGGTYLQALNTGVVGSVTMKAQNTTSTGFSQINITNNDNTVRSQFQIKNTAFTPNGIYIPGGVYLESDGPRLAIANYGSGTIDFATGVYSAGTSPTIKASISSAGNFNIGNAVATNQRLFRVGQGTASIDFGSYPALTTAAAIYMNELDPTTNPTNYTIKALDDKSTSYNGSGVFTSIKFNDIHKIYTDATRTTYLNPELRFIPTDVVTSGSRIALGFEPPMNTGQTAGANIQGGYFQTVGRQWATGAKTLQEEWIFYGTPYSFVGASTITDAATLNVYKPTAGTNATITYPLAAIFNGGIKIIDGTQSNGYVLTSDAAGRASWQTPSASDGTYTPTLANTTNVSASTAYVTGYYRVGNSVTVYGKIDIDVTLAASTASELQISLPIASNLAAEQDLGGNATSDSIASLVARIKGDATTDKASVVFKALSLTNDSYSFEFSYQVK